MECWKIPFSMLIIFVSSGCSQERSDTIVFVREPGDVFVDIGIDAIFPCIILDTTTNITHQPSWNISSQTTHMLYHIRELPQPTYKYNGSALIVHNVNSTLDGSSYACCLEIYFQQNQQYGEICSRTGKLHIIPNCETPQLPSNSRLSNFNSTVRGSEVIYQCDQGLFPPEEMTAVCTLQESGDGRWSPNPEELECYDFCTYINEARMYQTNSTEIGDVSATVTVSCQSSLNESMIIPSENLIIVLRQSHGNNGHGSHFFQENGTDIQDCQNGSYSETFSGLSENTMYTVSLIIISRDRYCVYPTNTTFTTAGNDNMTALVVSLVVIFGGIIPLAIGLLIIIIIVCCVFKRRYTIKSKDMKHK